LPQGRGLSLNSSSLDHPLTIVPDQGSEIVGIEKKVMEGRTMRSACWLNHDPSGLADALPAASTGPAMMIRRSRKPAPARPAQKAAGSESSFDVSRLHAPRRGQGRPDSADDKIRINSSLRRHQTPLGLMPAECCISRDPWTDRHRKTEEEFLIPRAAQYLRGAGGPADKLTFDYQFIANPGYNTDRGPANIFAGLGVAIC
jgi:hypothetical protein